MSNTKEIYLTEDGLKELQDELKELKEVKRPEVIAALKEARSLGDLSENAEYDAARASQAEVEGRIKELEVMLENVVMISGDNDGKVSIGCTVKIKYVDDDETEEYKVVGSKEADPFNNRISNESPIAKAIMGKGVGDIVSVDSPNGTYDIEIVSVN